MIPGYRSRPCYDICLAIRTLTTWEDPTPYLLELKAIILRATGIPYSVQILPDS
jgi:hypothetical protein